MALALKVPSISYWGKLEHQNIDPRYYQIGVLAALLVYGLIQLDFEVTPLQILLILTTASWTQLFCTRAWKLPSYDPRSALISGLSLCLLMRTDSLWLAVVSTAVAILSKFVLRVGTKHLFNPTNFGLVCMVGLTDRVWVSPGQWGNDAIFAFFMACLGGFVVNRALRSDVSLAFLGFYAALLLSRSLWLGEPLSIPLHRLHNGALLLFSFFMISDPRTTPNSKAGRLLFAMMVALGVGTIQFVLFQTNGLLWSLALCSLSVPVIDKFLPGQGYTWPTSKRISNQASKIFNSMKFNGGKDHEILETRNAYAASFYSLVRRRF